MRLLLKLLLVTAAPLLTAACLAAPSTAPSADISVADISVADISVADISLVGQRTAASTPCVFGQVKASRDSGIFEVPNGRFYSWTTADMICFDTAALAQKAGFSPSQR